MWIEQIKLINFQKHSDLEINLTNGVNVIYGNTDAGKSCIRRSIEWICFNSKIDGIRKTNTKMTSVSLTLNNNIIIERQRSASINRYIIHKDGQDITFDAIGKSIPQEVKDILKLEPITIDGEDMYLNSSPQISLPFLFNKSPTFRMKLFNKLSGNDILDKLFVKFNKDILSITREHKREEAETKKQIEQIKEIEIKKEKMEAIHNSVEKSVHNLRQIVEKHSKLLEISELITNTRNSITETQDKLNNINIPKDTEIKELTDKLERLTNLKQANDDLKSNKSTLSDVENQLKNITIPGISEIDTLTTNLERLEALKTAENDHERVKICLDKVRGQLKEINVPTLNYGELLAKLERIETLKNIKKDLDNAKKQCYTLNERDKELTKEIATFTKEHKELLKSLGICPTCDQEIK